jgi:RNA polymerase sigma-70 factor (ECF subfamily)
MLSDQEIIARVQAGERELFGELHARHHERVYRFIGRSIWACEAAQDVAGEVWLRAYAAVDRFEARPEAGVLAWLLRIAANAVTDYRRRLGPETQPWECDEAPTLYLVEGSAAKGNAVEPRFSSPGAESEVLRRERARAVHRALALLSEGDRRIIMLAHQDELSSPEIAVILGKPSTSAVTSHLHRAMNHLRLKLASLGWIDDCAESERAPAKRVSNA